MDDTTNYHTPAAAIANLVNDGTEFILITRTRQGTGFKVYSSGDKEVTQQLFRQARSQVDQLEPTA